MLPVHTEGYGDEVRCAAAQTVGCAPMSTEGAVTEPTAAAPRSHGAFDDPAHAAARLLGWGLVALAVAWWHNRWWASPNLEAFSLIARHLGADPFTGAGESDYLLSNLALPVLARMTGTTAPHRYAALHLVVLVVGLGVCVGLAQHRHGYRTARTLLAFVAVSPGVTVVMQWLGQPDALTFPLAIATVLVRRRVTFVGLAVLLGLNHPEQAVLIVAVAAVVRVLLGRSERPAASTPARPVWLEGAIELGLGWAGVLVGRAVTELYLRLADIGTGQVRSDYLSLGREVLVEHHGRAPLALVYLLWGPMWLVLVAIVVRLVLRRRSGDPAPTAGRDWAVLGGLALVALLPVAITLDETRVYAMLTAPVLAAAAVLSTRELRAVSVTLQRVGAAVLLVFTLVVPGGFTAGAAAWSHEIPEGEFRHFLVTGEHPGGELFLWLLSPFHFVFPDLDGA